MEKQNDIEAPTELMEQVRDGLLLIDTFLIEHFGIEDGAKRASLCITCMKEFGNLKSMEQKKVFEVVTTLINK